MPVNVINAGGLSNVATTAVHYTGNGQYKLSRALYMFGVPQFFALLYDCDAEKVGHRFTASEKVSHVGEKFLAAQYRFSVASF